MSVRDDLVKALEGGDELAVRRLGWWPPYEAFATWWRPKQSGTAHDFVVFAKLLGNFEPSLVLDAFTALAGDWRPHPAALLGWINKQRTGDESTVNIGRGRDRTSTAEAIVAVARAIDAGEQACACAVRSPKWRCDRDHVLRCPVCGGLEVGQVYAVEDVAVEHVDATNRETRSLPA